MKFISKLFNTLAGIFRILVTIAFLWGMVFTLFVNRNLLTSFYDLLGFDSIAPEIIKMLTAIIFAFAFFINFLVSKRIFKANKTGSYHMFNMVFGFIFLCIDLGIYFFTREKILIYVFGFSGLLILGSMFGLGAKARGLYPSQDLAPETKEETKEEEIKEEKIDSKKESKEEEDQEPVQTYDSEDLKEKLEAKAKEGEEKETINSEDTKESKEERPEESLEEEIESDSKEDLDKEDEQDLADKASDQKDREKSNNKEE